jgi:hypothetical protein
MHWPREGINPFPSPHRDEPTGLRADILDELADHLALSAEKELTSNGQTEEGAWTRALDRFGDPDAVARRLWWDAMKGKVMRDWIQTGIAGLSAVVVLFVGIYVIMNMQSMQATQAQLAETLQKINSQSQTPAGESLDIEVRRGKPDGPPAAGVRVELWGKIGGRENQSVSLETDAQGRIKFFPVPEGTYAIIIHDPQSGMTLHSEHNIFAGVGTARKFVAPDVALVRAQVALKQPLPFPNDRMLVYVKCGGSHSVGDCHWSPEAEFLVGNAGMYELVREAGSSQGPIIKAPTTMLLLPAIALTFTACPILRNSGYPPDQVCWEEIPSQKAIQSVTLTASQENVVTMELTANQMQKAEQYMKAYAAKRWMPERNASEPPPLDGYVWAAHPIEDTVRVRCGMTDIMADAAPATVPVPNGT